MARICGAAQPERSQYLQNGFLNEFQVAQNNLAIARGGNINQNTGVTNFGNQGLPGQQTIPILQTAIGNTTDSTTASYLMLGQAGTSANSIATNAARMADLTNANYPVNMFVVNPHRGGAATRSSDQRRLLESTTLSRWKSGVAWPRVSQFNGSYQFAKALPDGATVQ